MLGKSAFFGQLRFSIENLENLLRMSRPTNFRPRTRVPRKLDLQENLGCQEKPFNRELFDNLCY